MRITLGVVSSISLIWQAQPKHVKTCWLPPVFFLCYFEMVIFHSLLLNRYECSPIHIHTQCMHKMPSLRSKWIKNEEQKNTRRRWNTPHAFILFEGMCKRIFRNYESLYWKVVYRIIKEEVIHIFNNVPSFNFFLNIYNKYKKVLVTCYVIIKMCRRLFPSCDILLLKIILRSLHHAFHFLFVLLFFFL